MVSDREFARTLRLRRTLAAITLLPGAAVVFWMVMAVGTGLLSVSFWLAFVLTALITGTLYVMTLAKFDEFITRASILMDEADRRLYAERSTSYTYRP